MHNIIAVQKIPASVEKVWEFFSNPGNLLLITPADMKIKVISNNREDHIFPGLLIDYRVSPVLGISMAWQTEIIEVIERGYFADEQRKGPYLVWHHEHYFKEIEGGVEMTDKVQYKNRLGWFGRVLNTILVRNKIKKLFEYRFQKVEELFGKWENQEPSLEIK